MPAIETAVTYAVTLSDLIDIADGAAELDGMRMFLVDQPDQMERVAERVARMHDIVERAAGQDAARIYAEDDGSAA